jgi:hypothetical protein
MDYDENYHDTSGNDVNRVRIEESEKAGERDSYTENMRLFLLFLSPQQVSSSIGYICYRNKI